jgi:hypothetical protein
MTAHAVGCELAVVSSKLQAGQLTFVKSLEGQAASKHQRRSAKRGQQELSLF